MAILKKRKAPPFEVAEAGPPYSFGFWQIFRVGACNGLWRAMQYSYEILAIDSDQPGNGDFEYTMQYFYTSCLRDKKDFIIREVWNKRLKQHLITKRGFVEYGTDDVIKHFRNGN